MAGKQVRLYLVDGSVGGLMTAEIGNWTGHLLKGKRLELGKIRARAETARTGVYFLFGTSPEGDRLAYIGQSDDVAKRLVSHDAKKDFWDEVVIVTSKDANLTSAHVRYLESRLTQVAKTVARCTLTNVQEPTGGAELPEADASDMDYFIEQVRILMPVLGYDIFRGRTALPPADQSSPAALESSPASAMPAPGEAPVDSPVFALRTRLGVDARAQVLDGEFTVLQGSIVSAVMRRSAKQTDSTARQFAHRSAQHADFMSTATPIPDSTLARLSQDVVFTSPSAAASVVLGRASANGRVEWVAPDGLTYGVWEQRQTGEQPLPTP